MWASSREAKGVKSIDTKVLAVELKWFIVIRKWKGIGGTQLGCLVKCRAVLRKAIKTITITMTKIVKTLK